MSSNTDEAEQPVVEIDRNKLDQECIKLPTNYLRWANRAADCRLDVDESKAELEVVEAELAKEIRKDPIAFGLEKVTVDGLRAVIVLHKRYIAVQQKHIKALHNLQLCQAVVGALEVKKRSLTLLVELFGLSYFAAPKLSKQGQEAVTDMMRRRTRLSNDD